MEWWQDLYNRKIYFDLYVKKIKGYSVKNAILITVDEAFDLDKGKVVK